MVGPSPQSFSTEEGLFPFLAWRDRALKTLAPEEGLYPSWHGGSEPSKPTNARGGPVSLPGMEGPSPQIVCCSGQVSRPAARRPSMNHSIDSTSSQTNPHYGSNSRFAGSLDLVHSSLLYNSVVHSGSKVERFRPLLKLCSLTHTASAERPR